MAPAMAHIMATPTIRHMPQFFLGIYNNNDCSGLSGYAVPVSNASGSISNGTYQNKLTLRSGQHPERRQQGNDQRGSDHKLGNITIVPKQLIYDPANTAQSGTPNTAGLPVLNSNTAPSVNSANSARSHAVLLERRCRRRPMASSRTCQRAASSGASGSRTRARL